MVLTHYIACFTGEKHDDYHLHGWQFVTMVDPGEVKKKSTNSFYGF